MFVEPEQCLSRTAQFRHLVEDEGDSVLYAPIRILLQMIVRLYEANGCSNDQLAPACFLVTRRERALPEKIEFILVEAALEAKQKPVVALARDVNGLLIDQHRVDDTAHLDQLLPITTI